MLGKYTVVGLSNINLVKISFTKILVSKIDRNSQTAIFYRGKF